MTADSGEERGSRLYAVADWLTRPVRKWDPSDSGIGAVPAGALDATHLSPVPAVSPGVPAAPGASAAPGIPAAPSGPAAPDVRPWRPDDGPWHPEPEPPAAAPLPAAPPLAAPPPAAQTARRPDAPPEPPAPGPAPRTLPPMADTGTTHHPARRVLAEWPILLVLGGVAFGMSLVLGAKDNLLSGTFVMGMTLILAAALRLFLPTRTAGSLAIRRKFIDVAMYTLLGFTLVALGLMVQGIFGG